MDETSGMSEMERRREMRRRRILANQGQRMNKVMGVAPADEGDVSVNKSSSNGVDSSLAAPAAVGNFLRDGGEPREEEHVCQNNSIPGGAQLLDSLITNTLRGGNMSSSSSSNGSTQVPDIFSLLNADNLQTATQQEEVSQQTLAQQQHFHKFRQVLCFVIGIIVRLSLLTSFGAEYVQTMVYPFITLEIAILGYQRATYMDLCAGAGGGGGMWLTVLQMSGINRNIIHTYKQVMGAVASVMDDFTSYFFAFILTHLLVMWT